MISKRASEYLRNSRVDPAVMSLVAMRSYWVGGMGRRWDRRASRKTGERGRKIRGQGGKGKEEEEV